MVIRSIYILFQCFSMVFPDFIPVVPSVFLDIPVIFSVISDFIPEILDIQFLVKLYLSPAFFFDNFRSLSSGFPGILDLIPVVFSVILDFIPVF